MCSRIGGGNPCPDEGVGVNDTPNEVKGVNVDVGCVNALGVVVR
jgi:hypothetical protein